MLNLADLCTSFSSFPSLAKIITLDDVNKFLGLVCHFLVEITLHVPLNSKALPYQLPIYIHKLFCSCLGLDEDDVVCMWDVLKDVIWENPEQGMHYGLSMGNIDEIYLHGGVSVRPEERLGALS